MFREMPPFTKAEDMESWEVLRRIIPKNTRATAIVARYLHTTADYVRRWCLPPPEENDDGTGFRNPIDKVCDLIDAAFVIDPIESALIPEFINEFYRQLVRRHERVGFGGSDARRDAVGELLSDAVGAVNSLNIEGVTENTLNQVVRLNEACSRIKEKVQAELASAGHRGTVSSLPARLQNREGGNR
jgi:hypothetical protein